MMRGKEKCKILREIRQRIADENEIPFVTRECKYQGECRGTCPKCESELRYLEQQLAQRQSLGRRVSVAALCAGMAFVSAGCTRPAPLQRGGGVETDLTGAVAIMEPTPEPTPEVYVETGEVAWPEETEGPADFILTGDVADA